MAASDDQEEVECAKEITTFILFSIVYLSGMQVSYEARKRTDSVHFEPTAQGLSNNWGRVNARLGGGNAFPAVLFYAFLVMAFVRQLVFWLRPLFDD